MASPFQKQQPLRFFPLLTACSAGTLVALGLGRGLLLQLPRPNPEHNPIGLAVEQRWALNPERRRQAALLRASGSGHEPARRQALLAGQGWGQGPVAAVVLKQQALAATTLGQTRQAQRLWQQLLRRHGQEPASADALYALGQQQPQLLQTLLQRWPAHPAALAAASSMSSRRGALHLARWGARWPGAAARISAACGKANTTAAQRQRLAQGLAEVGSLQQAQACLAGATPSPDTALVLAKATLDGSATANAAIASLLRLIQQQPQTPQAEAAVRLLADADSPGARAALAQLPPRWQASAPVQASLARQAPGSSAALVVLQRWPTDPASWELQWQRARQAALAGRWQDTLQLLQAGGAKLEAAMPLALQARRQFWLGLSHWQLGQPTAARSAWQSLLQAWPGGYYGWRAAARLQGWNADTQSPAFATHTAAQRQWTPLASGRAAVDELWRLGQPLEAWELWRTQRRGQPPRSSQELQAEGRLREAIGDQWTGLGQQELAALRLPPDQCGLQRLIETNLYRSRQPHALGNAARDEGIPLPLLLGIAKQESRFQSDAQSVVGAVGLLQLMPETAAEVAGQPLTAAQLTQPERNARLGGRYLSQLLQRWSNNTLLAVASYNAGPNAVARWLTPTLRTTPELWVEAIPYPETRHYVKTVLGNSWSFAAPRLASCNARS